MKGRKISSRLLAMLKRLARTLGLVRSTGEDCECNKQLILADINFSLSAQLKDTTIRIVHAGGREELYQHPIPASHLIGKYPNMRVARPDVFENPHESVLSAEHYLLPGNKYYLVPSSTVQKLKRRHLPKGNVKQEGGSKQPILALKDVSDVGGECSEDPVCSAKEFFLSKDKWSYCLLRRTREEKKPFAPPHQKPRICKEVQWEPSLPSIQEVSP